VRKWRAEADNVTRRAFTVTTRLTMPISAALIVLLGCTTNQPRQAGQQTEQALAMRLMLADVDQVRAYAYGAGDRQGAETAANDLVQWSKRIGELFPPGQASVDYVDMSPERVSGAPAALQGQTGRLLAAVKTGDRASIGAALAQTERDGCGYCHRTR
jgi:hypothetical protein